MRSKTFQKVLDNFNKKSFVYRQGILKQAAKTPEILNQQKKIKWQ